MDGLLRDLRYAARSLRRPWTPTAVSVACLGPALAAAVVVFSVARAVLLVPLPLTDPERLFVLQPTSTQEVERTLVPAADYLDWRRQLAAFEGLAAWVERGVDVEREGSPRRLSAVLVSDGFFDLLGAGTAVGRTPTAHPEDRAAAVLGHRHWLRDHGGDRSLVGSTLVVDGRVHTVVGVLDARFGSLLGEHDLWMRSPEAVPLPGGPFTDYAGLEAAGAARAMRYLRVIGRLHEGVPAERARDELAAAGQRLASEHPRSHGGWTLRLRRLHETVTETAHTPLALAAVATLLLFLVALANVANLRVVGILARQGELATQGALGARRRDVCRRLAAEAGLLAALGGGLGLLLAAPLLAALPRWLPDGAPRIAEVGLGPAGAAFAVGTTLAVAVVLTALSWLAAGAVEPGSLLRPRRTPTRRPRLRATLVAVQVAFAMVLVVDSALLLDSLRRLGVEDLGFADERLLVVDLHATGAPSGAGGLTEALARIDGLGGVESCALGSGLPLSGEPRQLPWVAEGGEAGTGPVLAGLHVVGDGYFRDLGVPLAEGRELTTGDTQGGEPVAVLSRTAARRLLPGVATPVGHRVAIARPVGEPWWLTVVGVVGDLPYAGLREPPGADVYLPLAQSPLPTLQLVVRSRGEVKPVTGAVLAVLAETAPTYAISAARGYDEVRAEPHRELRAFAVLFSALGGAALLIAAAGLYGLLHLALFDHRQELSIRLALGAPRRRVAAGIVARGLRILVPGLLLGAATTLVLTGLLSHLVFGSAAEAAPAMAAGGALVAVCGLLSFLPTVHRVLTLQPADDLRHP